MTRIWTLNETLSEEYCILKNGIPLDSDEIADFDKFLFSIIPPELFNLYFFDGEKIADFFLEEGSNARIKGAFLTLCGYDIFDIMSKNFVLALPMRDLPPMHLMNTWVQKFITKKLLKPISPKSSNLMIV